MFLLPGLRLCHTNGDKRGAKERRATIFIFTALILLTRIAVLFFIVDEISNLPFLLVVLTYL